MNKNAQLSLTNTRDAKPCQKFLQFEVITSSSQVGNLVFSNELCYSNYKYVQVLFSQLHTE